MRILKNQLLILLFWLVINPVFGQDLLPKEQNDIKNRAISLVKEFEQLLNAIANKSTNQSEVQELITICYSDESNRIFLDGKCVLEDDITPGAADSTFVKDVSIQKYLNDIDLFYNKSYDESIKFSQFRLSEIKKKDYVFLKVYFESEFKERHKEIDAPYTKTRRVAEIRADKINNQWVSRIASIIFFKYPKGSTPEQIQEKAEAEYKPFVPIKTITIGQKAGSDSASAVFNAQLKQKNDSLYAAAVKEQTEKLEEQKQKEDAYKKAISKADSLLAKLQLTPALDAYTEARSVKPYESYPRGKINEITKLLASGRTDEKSIIEGYITDSKRFIKLRNYEGARQVLQQAFSLQPENGEIKSQMALVDKTIRIKNELRSRYSAGDFRGAIREYNKVINDDRNNALYYFERGFCYQKWNETKKAIADFSKAIELDPAYSEAILVRAGSYQKNNEIPKAIADYSTLLSIDKTDPQVFSKRAAAYQLTNDNTSAALDYQEAIKLEPKNPIHLTNLANVFYKLQNLPEALKSVNQALALNPSFSDAYYTRSFILMDQGKLKEAEEDIQKCRGLGLSGLQLMVYEKSAKLNTEKGQAALNAKNYDEAIRLSSLAIIMKGEYAEAWFLKGEANLQKGNYDAAIESYHKNLIYAPANFISNFKIGEANFLAKKLPEAIRFYSKALYSSPKFKDGLVKISDAYLILNNYDSAIYWLSRLIDMDPQNGTAFRNRGTCHFKKENYKRAMMDLETAIQTDKKSAESFFMLGSVYRALKDPEKALPTLEKAEDLGYNKFQVLFVTGLVYKDQGNQKKSLKYFTEAIKADPSKAAPFYERALVYLQKEDLKEAMADLDEAIKMDTSLATPEHRLELGFLKLRFEEYSDAEKQFNKSLDINPYNPRANYGLASVYANTGNIEKALTLFETAFLKKTIRWDQIKKDPWLKPVQKNKTFKKLVDLYLK